MTQLGHRSRCEVATIHGHFGVDGTLTGFEQAACLYCLIRRSSSPSGMPSRTPLRASPQITAYLTLLVVQTAAATFLFWLIFPLFRQMVMQLGQPQQVSLLVEFRIALTALILHCAYWARYRWVALATPLHSLFMGHLVQFAGRTSFFFGGALFSVIFFRHVPALAAIPTVGQTLVKGSLVLWVLFGLFCYSLELDRLGAPLSIDITDYLTVYSGFDFGSSKTVSTPWSQLAIGSLTSGFRWIAL